VVTLLAAVSALAAVAGVVIEVLREIDRCRAKNANRNAEPQSQKAPRASSPLTEKTVPNFRPTIAAGTGTNSSGVASSARKKLGGLWYLLSPWVWSLIFGTFLITGLVFATSTPESAKLSAAQFSADVRPLVFLVFAVAVVAGIAAFRRYREDRQSGRRKRKRTLVYGGTTVFGLVIFVLLIARQCSYIF
jgi:hypothetical protein